MIVNYSYYLVSSEVGKRYDWEFEGWIKYGFNRRLKYDRFLTKFVDLIKTKGFIFLILGRI